MFRAHLAARRSMPRMGDQVLLELAEHSVMSIVSTGEISGPHLGTCSGARRNDDQPEHRGGLVAKPERNREPAHHHYQGRELGRERYGYLATHRC